MGNDTKVLLTDKRIKEDLLKKASSGNLYFFLIAALILAALFPLFLFSEELSFQISSYERTAALITCPPLVIFFLSLSFRIALQRSSIKRGSFLVTEEVLDSVEFAITSTSKRRHKLIPVLNFRRCQYAMIESTDLDKDIEKLEREIGSEVYLVFASAADNNPLLVYSKNEYERTN